MTYLMHEKTRNWGPKGAQPFVDVPFRLKITEADCLVTKVGFRSLITEAAQSFSLQPKPNIQIAPSWFIELSC